MSAAALASLHLSVMTTVAETDPVSPPVARKPLLWLGVRC